MMAGSDFIKTSTGKEALNATLVFGVVMSRAINDYYNRTGYKVSYSLRFRTLLIRTNLKLTYG